MAIQIAFYQILHAALLVWGLRIRHFKLMHQAPILYQNYTDSHSLITIVCTINVIPEYRWWHIYAEEPQDKENGIELSFPEPAWIALIWPQLGKLFESAVHCYQVHWFNDAELWHTYVSCAYMQPAPDEGVHCHGTEGWLMGGFCIHWGLLTHIVCGQNLDLMEGLYCWFTLTQHALGRKRQTLYVVEKGDSTYPGFKDLMPQHQEADFKIWQPFFFHLSPKNPIEKSNSWEVLLNTGIWVLFTYCWWFQTKLNEI